METYLNFYNAHYPSHFIIMIYGIDLLNCFCLKVCCLLSIRNNNYDMMSLVCICGLACIFDSCVRRPPFLFGWASSLSLRIVRSRFSSLLLGHILLLCIFFLF